MYNTEGIFIAKQDANTKYLAKLGVVCSFLQHLLRENVWYFDTLFQPIL